MPPINNNYMMVAIVDKNVDGSTAVPNALDYGEMWAYLMVTYSQYSWFYLPGSELPIFYGFKADVKADILIGDYLINVNFAWAFQMHRVVNYVKSYGDSLIKNRSMTFFDDTLMLQPQGSLMKLIKTKETIERDMSMICLWLQMTGEMPSYLKPLIMNSDMSDTLHPMAVWESLMVERLLFSIDGQISAIANDVWESKSACIFIMPQYYDKRYNNKLHYSAIMKMCGNVHCPHDIEKKYTVPCVTVIQLDAMNLVSEKWLVGKELLFKNHPELSAIKAQDNIELIRILHSLGFIELIKEKTRNIVSVYIEDDKAKTNKVVVDDLEKEIADMLSRAKETAKLDQVELVYLS